MMLKKIKFSAKIILQQKHPAKTPLLKSLILGILFLLVIVGQPVMVEQSALAIGTQPTNNLDLATTNNFNKSTELAVGFIENVGQFNTSTYFQLPSKVGTLWLTEDGLWLSIQQLTNQGNQQLNLKLNFIGANPNSIPQGFNAQQIPVSYITPNTLSAQHHTAPVWQIIRYPNLYPGVDLEITSNGEDWTWYLINHETTVQNCQVTHGQTCGISPKSNNTNLEIELQINGANAVITPQNKNQPSSIQLDTDLGNITLPPLYTVDNQGNALPLPFVSPVTVNHSPQTAVGGSANKIVKPKSNSPASSASQLAIPQFQQSNLVYSAFLGGSSNDCFPQCAMAIDKAGYIYITGHTASRDFPIQPGAILSQNKGGDIFVIKLSPDGSTLKYATFFGGSDADYGTAIAVDQTGHAIVTGYTQSQDFPTSQWAIASRYRGGFSDAFVIKLTPDGQGIDYASFLGGENTERGEAITVDDDGYFYVVGQTESPDFPITSNAFDSTHNGNTDLFITRFNPSGKDLMYSTFFGGKAEDQSRSIALSPSGHIYITGKTTSDDFPTTDNSLFSQYKGAGDAFVLKLNLLNQGPEWVYSSFLGGSSVDLGQAISVDAKGNAYVTGSTLSTDFPTTDGSFDTKHHKGYDVFVTKLSPTGNQLLYATLLGGEKGDRAYDMAIDKTGSAYITGATYSADFPITNNTFDSSYNQGYTDAFMAKLSPDGSVLDYATFLGGSEPDYGTGIVVNNAGSAYLVGATSSPSFPSTVQSFDSDFNGEWDGFITRLDFGEQNQASIITGIVKDRQGNPIPDVVISAGNKGTTTTDANGVYVLIGLEAGAYTITANKPDFTFSPARQSTTIPNNDDLLVFTGVLQVEQPDLFLDLPFNYDGNIATFVRTLQDVNNHGAVTSWFDHAYPDYSKNHQLLLADGLTRNKDSYNRNLGCFERRCYDGHDGIDMVYREFGLNVFQNKEVEILAAATGTVVAIENSCVAGDVLCGFGLGNFVVLQHPNQYFTLYAHLQRSLVNPNDTLLKGYPLGIMGTTGNSTGYHLHFGVYRDNGNGKWDRGAIDKPVDPFGWQGNQADPWVVDHEGPISFYLWQHTFATEKAFSGKQGATLADTTGTIETTVPANAISGEARLELRLGPIADAVLGQQIAGQTFSLRLIEWQPESKNLSNNEDAVARLLNNNAIADGPVTVNLEAALAQPITLNASYTDLDVRHLNVDKLQFYRWDDFNKQWQALPSTVNTAAKLITAQTGSMGQFNLQAPLLCPNDIVEPDDHYFSARLLNINQAPLTRSFDTPQDEDWFYLEAIAGSTYTFYTSKLNTGVDTVLEIFDLTNSALLSKDATPGPSFLTWTAPRTATFYVRVAHGQNSAHGCDATYNIGIARAQYNIYLPIVKK